MFVRVPVLFAVTAMFGHVANAYEPHHGALAARHEPVTIYEVRTVTIIECDPSHVTEVAPTTPTTAEEEVSMPAITTPVLSDPIATVTDSTPSTRSPEKETPSTEIRVPSSSTDEVHSTPVATPTPTAPDENMGNVLDTPKDVLGALMALALLWV